MAKNIDVDQALILKKFKQWLKLKAKQDPSGFSEKTVKDLIKSFDLGYCSGFSWLHTLRKQRGEEELHFYQIKKMARWNGSAKTLDSDLDHLFNQFVQIAIFAHQAWATEAATSTGNFYNGENNFEEANRSVADAEGIVYPQKDAIIARSLAQAEEAFAITSFQGGYDPMNKTQSQQKIEDLLKDKVNAMLRVAGQCYSKRKDPSKHAYHAIDLGISEVNGEKKYWIYDPNHPKGTRYFDNFDDVFKGLQKAFFYKSHHQVIPLEFDRYELLEYEQKNLEISLKSVMPQHSESTRSEASMNKSKDKGKGKHKRRRTPTRSNRRGTLIFTNHHINKLSSFENLDKIKIAELMDIIEKTPVNCRIELANRDEDQAIQIKKSENGYTLWLSQDPVVVNNLETLFQRMMDHDYEFWKKIDTVTVFTQQFTEESKQKAALELALAIETGTLDTVKWCVTNGALERFSTILKKHHGHNPLTLALVQSPPNMDIIRTIVEYDLQHNLRLSEHIINAPGPQQGLNVVWIALLTGNVDIVNCIKTNYPQKQYNPINDGIYSGLSPLDVIKMQRPTCFVEAVAKSYPELVTANQRQKP